MRVLFVIHTPKDPHTAVFASIVERADHLRARGDTARILGPEDFQSLRRRSTRWRFVLLPIAIAAWLWRRRRDWDIVVFHSYTGWVFNLLRRRAPGWPRVVTQFHGLEPLAYKATVDLVHRTGEALSVRYRAFHGAVMPRLLRLTCRGSDGLLCLNEAERAYMISRGWASAGQIEVVGNSVPREFFVDKSYAPRATTLLFFGQWLPNKGIRYLVQMFEMLAAADESLRLVCLGTQRPAEAVRGEYQPVVRPRIEVHPAVTRGEIPAYMKQADIFVLPTISEGSSVALLEAMAAGLPIVTTPVGAAPDMLAHGESVLFVPVNDSVALAREVGVLIGDALLRRRLGRAAQAAARRFTSDVVVEHYCGVLASLCVGETNVCPGEGPIP